MNSSSQTAKVAAVSVALLLHGVVLLGLSGPETIEVEAGAGSMEVAFGSSFADMAAGTLEPEPTETTLEPLEPLQPEAAHQPPVSIEATDPPPPERLEQPSVVTATPVSPVIAKAPRTAQPSEIDAPLPTKSITAPAISEATLPADMAATSLERASTLQTAPMPSLEETEALEGNPTAVARSLRPKTRSKTFEQEHKTVPVEQAAKAKPKSPAKKKPVKTKKKAVAQPKGNSNKTAKAGSTTGTKSAKSTAKSSGQGTEKKAKGNAKASNYPGQVMRKIARVRKPRVGQKGAAVVAFTIAPNGGLSAVSVARSSGSSQLDKAALNVVRKAAPFPPPPAGARRSFSIKIKGG